MDQIVAWMGALRTACLGSPCIADCPSQNLTVRAGSDVTPPQEFSGNCSFTGCLLNYTPTVPEVDHNLLVTLQGILDDIVAAHCSDVGACTEGGLPRDSGVDAPTD
jgi:hypothetical protein